MEMSMTRRIKAGDLPEFDAAPYLDSEVATAAYLADILEANDPALPAAALGDIARAHGMSEIAKASGLTRPIPGTATRRATAFRHDQPRLHGPGCAPGGAAIPFLTLCPVPWHSQPWDKAP